MKDMFLLQITRFSFKTATVLLSQSVTLCMFMLVEIGKI